MAGADESRRKGSGTAGGGAGGASDPRPVLHATAMSLYCAKTRILLRHKGIDFREVPPKGGYGSDRWRRLAPAGNLPALEHAGVLIADSEAIAEYLEEIRPEPAMLPEAPALRALVRQRGRFHDTRLEPALRALFGWLRPGAAAGGPGQGLIEALQQRLGQLGQLLEMEEGRLEEGRLWLGDCGFAASFPWIDAVERRAGRPLDWPERAAGYRRRLGDVPAVVDEYAVYGPAVAGWLESP